MLSTLETVFGYCEMKIDEHNRDYVPFMTDHGLHKFNKMPGNHSGNIPGS